MLEPCTAETEKPVRTIEELEKLPLAERHRASRGVSDRIRVAGRVVLVPAEPAGLEALAVGWAEGGLGLEERWGHGPEVGWADGVPLVVGELEASGVLGVAGDGVGVLVVEAVVESAEAHQVGGHGEAAVFAVEEVVDLDPAALCAAGVAAALVALFDHGPQPRVHGRLQG